MCGVYEIVNTANGKRYIGSSSNISKRWNEHIRSLNDDKHHSRYLQRSWLKYGQNCFEFSMIECCDKLHLIQREQFYLDNLKPEYNTSPTARSPLGVKHTEETRKKVSDAGKGRIFSEEHKRKISEALKGRVFSTETLKKIGEKSRGRFFSQETRQKMSLAHVGRKYARGFSLSEETKQKISKSLIGNKRTLGIEPWNKGKTGLQNHNIETREKMSLSHLGKNHSEETKKKMSETRRRYWKEKRRVDI